MLPAAVSPKAKVEVAAELVANLELGRKSLEAINFSLRWGLSMTDIDASEELAPSHEDVAEPAVESLAGSSLLKALASARDRLLDRSLRNKLISTPITSARARQVRVFDELADEVFTMLRSGKPMTFTASGGADADSGDDYGDSTWVPPEYDDGGLGGPAARHADRLHDAKDGLSAFDLMGRMSLLKAKATPAPTFKFPAAASWSPEKDHLGRMRLRQDA